MCIRDSVSAIDLAYDSNDQISEFTVEWQYSFFTAGKGLSKAATGTAEKSTASTRTVV